MTPQSLLLVQMELHSPPGLWMRNSPPCKDLQSYHRKLYRLQLQLLLFRLVEKIPPRESERSLERQQVDRTERKSCSAGQSMFHLQAILDHRRLRGHYHLRRSFHKYLRLRAFG